MAAGCWVSRQHPGTRTNLPSPCASAFPLSPMPLQPSLSGRVGTHCDTWVMGASSVSPSKSRSSAKLLVLRKWGGFTSSSVGLFLTVERVGDSTLGLRLGIDDEGAPELGSDVHLNLPLLWERPVNSQAQGRSRDGAQKLQAQVLM